MNTAKFLNWTVVFDKITNLSKAILFQKIEDVINPLFMYLLWTRFLFILPSNRGFFSSIFTHTQFFFSLMLLLLPCSHSLLNLSTHSIPCIPYSTFKLHVFFSTFSLLLHPLRSVFIPFSSLFQIS